MPKMDFSQDDPSWISRFNLLRKMIRLGQDVKDVHRLGQDIHSLVQVAASRRSLLTDDHIILIVVDDLNHLSFFCRFGSFQTAASWSNLSHRIAAHFSMVLSFTDVNGAPAEFTFFGVAEHMDEYGIVELLRPDWDENGTMGKELCDWFDMQVEELCDFLLVHRLPYDIAENNIIVEMPDNVLPRAITTWTAVLLTCTLTVLKEPDEYTGQLYCLDVVKVDPMYKNMD
ncbi:hypothetical protein B0H14DRAFT_2598178 [Mycena olivaceomarginata]|nr:hypothetical protein B0H14DRAFT_2598178 [Mycena olivaceomarginata]